MTSDIQNQTSVLRSARLATRLLRHEVRAEAGRNRPESEFAGAGRRGALRAAAQAVEARVTESVTPEELATTIATLDKIAGVLGGREALPPREHRRGRGHGHGQGFRRHRGYRGAVHHEIHIHNYA